MSALADALRALIPFAERPVSSRQHAAQDVLRKHAPCEGCDGRGGGRTGPGISGRTYEEPCGRCHGAGWTRTSVDARIAKEAT